MVAKGEGKEPPREEEEQEQEQVQEEGEEEGARRGETRCQSQRGGKRNLPHLSVAVEVMAWVAVEKVLVVSLVYKLVVHARTLGQ